MDARYLEAVVNEDGQHVVLGRRLHPFCFSDIQFLEIDDNPLWFNHRKISWGDLFNATLVCATEPDVCGVPWSLWSRCKMTLWVLWGRRRYSLQAEVDKFAAYVKDYYTRPRIWASDEGKTVKAPWLLSIAVYIEAHSNLSERQIMRAPAGKMLWKYAAIAEVLHGADVMSEEEENAFKELGITLR